MLKPSEISLLILTPVIFMTLIISDPIFTSHLTGKNHPESPERFSAIEKALKEAGLQTSFNTLKPREACKEDLLRCHTESYVERVYTEIQYAKVCQQLDMLSTGDVIISPDSLQPALLAAGGVLTAVDALMSGQARTAFCNSRPPGHHACSDAGMGFCLFNNVAIGARYLQQKYGLAKVLIIDWDVHHGNGTQEIFYNDPSVLYFSTHQQGIYPGTGLSRERGAGNIINCPIDAQLDSRLAIFKAFELYLIPALELFQPHFIFISCGFDAHIKDPLGGLSLTTEDFFHLTLLTKKIAHDYTEGRIVSVLEGGYHLEALAESAVAHVRGLIAS